MAGLNIVGVQFRRAGKIYDFDAKDFLLAIGDRVVVETERGPSLAEVMRINFRGDIEEKPDNLKPIVRIATRKDLDSSGRLTPEHAMEFTKERIKKLELDMHVISVDIQFGGNKVIIYFSAPGRVDFRELVKELAGGLKTRVELKQVGARDEAKLAGGIGICGREFCCSSFLREFVPVSIKMAKNQNLALNPSKVSGGCGRLLCCLTYEDETYSELRQRLLPKGTRVQLEDGTMADVIKGDILNQLMLVETDNGELRSVPVAELETVEARSGENDDWGEDIDFDSLMGGEDITALDDSEQIRSQQRKPGEKSEPRQSRGRSGDGRDASRRQRPSRPRDDRRPHRSESSPSADSNQNARQSQDEGGQSRSRSRRPRGQKNPRHRNRSGKPGDSNSRPQDRGRNQGPKND